MLTVAEINEWLGRNHMSRKELSEMLGINYKSLCHVLSGYRPISEGLSARIEKVMARRSDSIRLTISDDMETVLRAWAAAADMSIEDLVYDLLSDALKIKRRD